MPADTIRVTDEMLEAGAAVLRMHYKERLGHDLNVAGDVFLSMVHAQAAAAARQSENRTEKPDEPSTASTLPPNEWR